MIPRSEVMVWCLEIRDGGRCEEKSKWGSKRNPNQPVKRNPNQAVKRNPNGRGNRASPCITAPCNHFVENMIWVFFLAKSGWQRIWCIEPVWESRSLHRAHESKKSWTVPTRNPDIEACIMVWFVRHTRGTILLQNFIGLFQISTSGKWRTCDADNGDMDCCDDNDDACYHDVMRDLVDWIPLWRDSRVIWSFTKLKSKTETAKNLTMVVVDCPTRLALSLLFGFLCWSSIFHCPDNREI